MDVIVYEKDKGFVLGRLREGEFDYVDAGDEVFEAEFFQYLGAKKYLREMAESYPSPRKKHEVPVWFYLASNVSMRLHNEHSFLQYKYVVRCGGMLTGLGPEVGKKVVNKDGDIELSCPGFNKKNDYPRETPCDQDYLRKMARDTEADRLQVWFNRDIARLWKKHKVYDEEGLFIGDGSYLFVPDNPRYEGSVRMLFDKHNHPVDPDKVRTEEIRNGQYQWRRCYKLVSLLHTDREGTFCLVAALRVVPGNRHECPVFYELLGEFVGAVGEGVVRRVVLDRGFLDGKSISHFKLEHGIDFLMPVKRSMDIYKDAMSLISEVGFEVYDPPRGQECRGDNAAQEPKPDKIRKREESRRKTVAAKNAGAQALPVHKAIVRREVGAISDFRTWDACSVPLTVVFCRDVYEDGRDDVWLLVDTAPVQDPSHSRDDYAIRTRIEEMHRQVKCFCDLTKFTSRAFSLVLNQVVFILLTYNLLQVYLLRHKQTEKNRSPFPMMRKKLIPAASWIIVFCEGKVGFFHTMEYTEILLTLEESARKKALRRTRRLRSEMTEMLRGPPGTF